MSTDGESKHDRTILDLFEARRALNAARERIRELEQNAERPPERAHVHHVFGPEDTTFPGCLW